MTIYVDLPGSTRPLLSGSRHVGSADRSEIASLTIRVRSSGDPNALVAEVHKQAALPVKARTYLIHAQLKAQHGAAKVDLDKIEEYAHAHNLVISRRSRIERTITLTGTVGKLLGAFPADLQLYDHLSGTYRGRRGAIQIPKDLSGIVTGVFGFDTRRRHHSARSLVKRISISWGSPEDASDQQGINAFHEVFVAAASLGITVCVSSGDHGTACDEAAHWDGQIHVDHPACDDMVHACGGTQIDETGTDVAWNDGTPFDKTTRDGGGWATGGGISVVFPVPAYQPNLPVSPVTSNPGRAVPDISMSATNYYTRVDKSEGASGGTSAVAPLMAALVARLNQTKGKNVGYLNTFLYANAATVTHPVVSGRNTITNTVVGYAAGPGCTGLGTPDGTAILNNI